MKKFFEDFKNFAMRGNLVDLAVAVVLGAAFGAVVTSFVNDIVLQIIAMFTPVAKFSDIMIGKIAIGAFLQTVINFILIAFILFVILKVLEKMKKEEVVEETVAVNEELETLKAILVELKNK